MGALETVMGMFLRTVGLESDTWNFQPVACSFDNTYTCMCVNDLNQFLRMNYAEFSRLLHTHTSMYYTLVTLKDR